MEQRSALFCGKASRAVKSTALEQGPHFECGACVDESSMESVLNHRDAASVDDVHPLGFLTLYENVLTG